VCEPGSEEADTGKQGSVFDSKAQNACRHVIDCPEASFVSFYASAVHMHDIFRSVRSVTKCAKLLLWVCPFRLTNRVGLILADLHILYVTKQNKNHYHQTSFLGLK